MEWQFKDKMTANLLHPGKSEMLTCIYNTTDKVKGTIVTTKSLLTGKDFTFKFRKSFFGEKSYLHVYVERGYLDFTYLGFYWQGKIFRKGGVEVTTTAAISIAWMFRQIEINKVEKLDAQVQLYHTGKCAKCNRTLTDATSIEIGLGPHCRNH